MSGDTRTGVGKEKSYFGTPKNVNYGEVVLAPTYYGLVYHAAAAADRVCSYMQHPSKGAGK